MSDHEIDFNITPSLIHRFDEPKYIAFDVDASDKLIGAYARAGHFIVYVAKSGELDDVWIDKALSRGAEIIISRDSDVGNYLDRNMHNAKWLRPKK